MLMKPEPWVYHAAWCFGGFFFPAAIMAIGLAFQRQYPPTERELAEAIVPPKMLSNMISVLALSHAGASLLAFRHWHKWAAVWVLTAVQLLLTLYVAFMALMAVQGTWL